MNYICDVLVNFNYPIYDFYDWNKNDNIKNIKKIPFYRISNNTLEELKTNKFKLINILDDIHNETTIYTNKKNKVIEYSTIFSSDKDVVAFFFDKNGICIGKSAMLPDEENEIINNSINVELKDIQYEVLSKDKIRPFQTRNQNKIISYILREIKEINDIDKLNYIYYECFSKYSDYPKRELINKLNTEWFDRYYKIYDFLHLIYMNKG